MKIKHIFALDKKCNQIDIKSCIPINLNMSNVTVGPFVGQAVKEFFCEYLGEDLYNWLAKGYKDSYLQDGEEVTESHYEGEEKECWDQLICCARCVIAWYAYWKMLPTLNISVSDSGVTQSFNEKTQPADTKAFNTAYWEAFNNAYGELERLIYKCLCPNKSKFIQYGFNPEPWCCRFLIASPYEFTNYVTLNPRGRMYTWIMLQPHLAKAEKIYLEPAFCGLYEEVKEMVCDAKCHVTVLDPKWQKLAECFSYLLADITIQISQAFLNLQPTGHGFKYVEQNTSPTKKHNPDYRGTQHLEVSVDKLSPKYWKVLLNYLKANKKCFPTWTNSECNPENGNCNTDCPKPKTCNCGCCTNCLNNQSGGDTLITSGNIFAL